VKFVVLGFLKSLFFVKILRLEKDKNKNKFSVEFFCYEKPRKLNHFLA